MSEKLGTVLILKTPAGAVSGYTAAARTGSESSENLETFSMLIKFKQTAPLSRNFAT